LFESLKERAKRLMADVPGEYVFRCVNGHVLRNMRELEAEFKVISEQDYAYHVNSRKNDFSNWVKDIIKDDSLAKSLIKASDRTQAARHVTGRLNDLSRLASR
jgi:hypothetical protein